MDGKLAKAQTTGADKIVETGDSRQQIEKHYEMINNLLGGVRDTFVRLFSSKERLLLDTLADKFEQLSKKLQDYEQRTSNESIQRLCEERKEEMKKKRVDMLSQYLKMSNDYANNKKLLQERHLFVRQSQQDLQNSRQLLKFIREQNKKFVQEMQRQPTIKPLQQIFSTQPAILEKSITKPSKHFKSRQHKPKTTAASTAIRKLHVDTYRCPKDNDFALRCLEIPEVKKLMICMLVQGQ